MNYSNNQNNILLQKLLCYYEDSNVLKEFINIVNGNCGVSLRLIDWFVTTYCKKNHIAYNIENNYFDVFQNYKLMGKSFKKRKFDPFCRGDRVKLTHEGYDIETTVGQLNFFKWAMTNKVVDYILERKDDLNQCHSDYVIEQKRNKMSKMKKEMNVNAVLNVYEKNVEIVASFDS